MVVLVVALAHIGGKSSTAASSSPSARPSVVAASPSHSATPLPAPTITGTIAFARVVTPGALGPGQSGNRDIYVVNTDGSGLKQLANDGSHPSWSPDGARIAYTSYRDGGLWVMNADGSHKRLLSEWADMASWSPDGTQIVFTRARWGPSFVFVVNADGAGLKRVPMHQAIYIPGHLAWTANGKILYGWQGDVFAVNPDGSGFRRLTKDANLIEFSASSDGKWIAGYTASDGVEVAPARGGGTVVTVLGRDSTPGGPAIAAWAPDGKALVVASSWSGAHPQDDGSPLYVVNTDGSGLSAVPGIDNAADPAWRPSSASPRPAVSYSRARPPATGTVTGMTPSTTARVSQAGTIGWQFTPSVDIKVTALGCFDAHRDGLARAHRVGIFDAESKRLLASVTVRPKSRLEGFFRWESLKTPLLLEAERLYVTGTEDKKTLETLYTWHSWPDQVDWSPPGGHWAAEIGPPAPLRMYVSRPSQAAFTAPTVTQDLWNNPPWFSPNFKFVPVSASSPTP